MALQPNKFLNEKWQKAKKGLEEKIAKSEKAKLSLTEYIQKWQKAKEELEEKIKNAKPKKGAKLEKAVDKFKNWWKQTATNVKLLNKKHTLSEETLTEIFASFVADEGIEAILIGKQTEKFIGADLVLVNFIEGQNQVLLIQAKRRKKSSEIQALYKNLVQKYMLLDVWPQKKDEEKLRAWIYLIFIESGHRMCYCHDDIEAVKTGELNELSCWDLTLFGTMNEA